MKVWQGLLTAGLASEFVAHHDKWGYAWPGEVLDAFAMLTFVLIWKLAQWWEHRA
jgi:hypothetical protein